MTSASTQPQVPDLPDSAPPARIRRRRTFAIASHLVRAILLVGLVAILTGVPANIDTWNDPNASVLPSERTMPGWGNYLLTFVALLAFGVLAAGWVARKKSAHDARGFRVLALAAAAGMTAWAALRFASQVISPRPQEGQLSAGIGRYGGALFGVLALATATQLVWDAQTRWRPAA